MPAVAPPHQVYRGWRGRERRAGRFNRELGVLIESNEGIHPGPFHRLGKHGSTELVFLAPLCGVPMEPGRNSLVLRCTHLGMQTTGRQYGIAHRVSYMKLGHYPKGDSTTCRYASIQDHPLPGFGMPPLPEACPTSRENRKETPGLVIRVLLHVAISFVVISGCA